MAGRYKIGRFEFDTYEEYVRGMADVKKIHKITHSVDIYDPDTALRLYQSIRAKKIRFYSKIGRQFFIDIADIVAKNTQSIIAEQEERKSPEQADRGRKILGIICIIAAVLCFVWYFWSDYTNYRGNKVNDYLKKLQQQEQQTVETVNNDSFFFTDAPEMEAAAAWEAWEEQENEKLQEARRADAESGENGTNNAAGESKTPVTEHKKLPERLPEYEAVFQENKDFAGWITIDGTKVDYPVMQTKTDTDFYLSRNFNGEKDVNGTLFLDARVNLADPGTNMIIYGHNMKSGQMFGGLKKYLDESYFNAHRRITFNTLYEKSTYEIFAVCLAQVQYQDADAFRYYNFIHADTKEEFDEFISNITQLSVFADKDLPVYGDQLLTLSTCNNFAEDGRLFVLAKKCRDAE